MYQEGGRGNVRVGSRDWQLSGCDVIVHLFHNNHLVRGGGRGHAQRRASAIKK